MEGKKQFENDSAGKDDYEETMPFIKKNIIFGNLTIYDLLYPTILGIMGGFISGLIPFYAIMQFYPFIGGSQLTSGHHLIWMTIAYGVSNKKKTPPILAGFFKGLMGALLGESLGAITILLSVLDGAAIAFFFWVIEKLNKSDTKIGWGLAAGIANFFLSPIYVTLFTGIFVIQYFFGFALIAFGFAFISGFLISGLLGYVITEGLKESMRK